VYAELYNGYSYELIAKSSVAMTSLAQAKGQRLP